jgi:alpha-beta hydrolase superfamily lysophospholipase
MRHEEGQFLGAGGLDLFYQRWRPPGSTRAVLAIVHGIGEHSGRYRNVVERFVAGGYAVYGFDHRGHGRSPGPRGHVRRWTDYRDDLGAFVRLILGQERESAVFVWGHSMGALVALDYALHHPEGLRGAVLSAPPMEPSAASHTFLVVLARIMSCCWPSFSVRLPLDGSALSRDPSVVQAHREDPLIHTMASARWSTEALATIAWAKQHAAELRLPVLLIHGDADRISGVQGTRRLYEAITFPDKSLRTYTGGYHEPHNDVDYEQVLDDAEQWLEEHLAEP